MLVNIRTENREGTGKTNGDYMKLNMAERTDPSRRMISLILISF